MAVTVRIARKLSAYLITTCRACGKTNAVETLPANCQYCGSAL